MLERLFQTSLTSTLGGSVGLFLLKAKANPDVISWELAAHSTLKPHCSMQQLKVSCQAPARCLPTTVSTSRGRLPHRRVAVKAVVAAPAEEAQQEQAPQSKGYKDALLVQCKPGEGCTQSTCRQSHVCLNLMSLAKGETSRSVSFQTQLHASPWVAGHFCCSLWLGQL